MKNIYFIGCYLGSPKIKHTYFIEAFNARKIYMREKCD